MEAPAGGPGTVHWTKVHDEFRRMSPELHRALSHGVRRLCQWIIANPGVDAAGNARPTARLQVAVANAAVAGAASRDIVFQEVVVAGPGNNNHLAAPF